MPLTSWPNSHCLGGLPCFPSFLENKRLGTYRHGLIANTDQTMFYAGYTLAVLLTYPAPIHKHCQGSHFEVLCDTSTDGRLPLKDICLMVGKGFSGDPIFLPTSSRNLTNIVRRIVKVFKVMRARCARGLLTMSCLDSGGLFSWYKLAKAQPPKLKTMTRNVDGDEDDVKF
jgi:hypothetical protein